MNDKAAHNDRRCSCRAPAWQTFASGSFLRWCISPTKVRRRLANRPLAESKQTAVQRGLTPCPNRHRPKDRDHLVVQSRDTLQVNTAERVGD